MTAKHVAQLNHQGFYFGAVEATESPLEPGVWHLPGGSVDAPLPRPMGPMECARHAPNGNPQDPWDYLPDYSGAVVYSVATGEPIALAAGMSLEEAGGTLQAPLIAETVEDLKAELQRAAAAKRWAVESGGITVGGVRVSTAIEDQNRITSVIANAGAAGVQAVDFKAASGWVSLTLPELSAVAAAIARHVQRCYSAERMHSEAIAALSVLADAQAYDLSTGWPDATPATD